MNNLSPVRSTPLACLVVLMIALILLVPQTRAEPAKPSTAPAAGVPTLRPSYDSFKLIHTRNVFDPDRRPIRPAGNAPAAAPVTRSDYVALTGTMLSPEKSYAFFSGSRPEFNKVLNMRQNIATATITGITAQSIEIERDGKQTTVAIGQTVPFDNQTAPGIPPADLAATATTTDNAPHALAPAVTPAAAAYLPVTSAAAVAAPKGAPANLDEIRRRMMEKRQQELK